MDDVCILCPRTLYLFTEGYFQYTAVQFYFVEIWYIEHMEGLTLGNR